MNSCWLMQLQILCCGLEDNVHLVSSLGANAILILLKCIRYLIRVKSFSGLNDRMIIKDMK